MKEERLEGRLLPAAISYLCFCLLLPSQIYILGVARRQKPKGQLVCWLLTQPQDTVYSVGIFVYLNSISLLQIVFCYKLFHTNQTDHYGHLQKPCFEGSHHLRLDRQQLKKEPSWIWRQNSSNPSPG